MSAWLEHVKSTMKSMPGKPLKEVLKEAKRTYKKGVSVIKYAVTGKKSRRSHKSHKKSAKKAHKKSHKKSAKKSRKHSKKSRGKKSGKRRR